jgi:hypothetical protein
VPPHALFNPTQAALTQRTIVVVSPCEADEEYCESTSADSAQAAKCVPRAMGCSFARLLEVAPKPIAVVRGPNWLS